MGKLFEDVLLAIHQHEEEDGIHDLWRRTIMKFYSKVIGEREYSVFETVHFGLRLPATLSSLPHTESVSVGDWATVKNISERGKLRPDDRVTYLSKKEIFDRRGEWERSSNVTEESISNLSFFAFWRLFHKKDTKILRRRKEAIVALTGNGWPAMAERSHPEHENYSRKTLYAYMPCAGLQGTEFIDDIVTKHYNRSYADMLRHFCRAKENKWCPPWIAKNYESQNPEDEETGNYGPQPDAKDFMEDSDHDEKTNNKDPEQVKFAHADKFKQKN